MLPHTPPTYVGTKRRTGPMDFHINKMRALNLSAKYMKKVEAELRGLPGTFNDLPVTPLMNIGEMVDSSAFDQVNKATADALKGKRMRKMASKTAKQASGTARRAAESVADAGRGPCNTSTTATNGNGQACTGTNACRATTAEGGTVHLPVPKVR